MSEIIEDLEVEPDLFWEHIKIVAALDLGIQVWRKVESNRDLFLESIDATNRWYHLISTSYPKTPVDCLISELRDYFFDDEAVLSRDEFEQRVAQFNEEVSDGNVS